MKYPVRGDKSFENPIKLGRRHILVLLAIIVDDIRERGVGVVDVMDEVLHLNVGLIDECPHLFRIPVIIVYISKVLSKLLSDSF
jgi:hypothetical protein